MFLYAVLIILSAYLINYVKNIRRFFKLLFVFPGKSGHIIFGDAWDFIPKTDEIFLMFRKYNKEFPNGYFIRSLTFGAVSITTAEHAEVVLSDIRYIKKSLLYKTLHPWLQTGLLTSTGQKWAKRRKLLTPAFHFNILKRLTKNFSEYNEYLLELLQRECKKNKSDIMPIISDVALNFICGTSMGVTLDVNDIKQTNYRDAIHKIMKVITDRMVHVWYFSDFIFRLSPLHREQSKALKILHGFTTDIIKERETNFDENEFNEEIDESYSKKKLAMLDLLLSAKRKRNEIDNEGIREEVDTFTFEGHDTVSMALGFALLLIANHKDHQQKIVKELDTIFGDSDRDASYEDLQNMNYLELCLKESLRLYPSVPIVSREAEEDIILDNKLVIPKGALIHVQIFDIHRKEKYFPNPEKFDPERFLPENSKNRHPFAYIPFSAGPRNCIGQKYAMLEMKSIISTILRNYELEPIDSPSDIVLALDLLLRPLNGIHLRFKPRVK